MESEESSRPSIGFPLGLALLLVLLLLMCGFLSCCLHWNKLRSLLLLGPNSTHQNSNPQQDLDQLPHKSATSYQEVRKKQAESLPVLMPGDEVPKFIAMACPCEPPVIENIIVKVHKLPSPSLPLYYN